MSKQRWLDTRFWEDYYISELDPIEKLLFLYFLLNSRTALCGAYEISLGIAAGETGIEKSMIKKIIDRFDNDNKLKYVDGFILIRNFGKYLNANPSVLLGIEREKKLLPQHIMDIVNTYCIQPGDSLSTSCIHEGDLPIPILIPKLIPKLKPKSDNTTLQGGVSEKPPPIDVRTTFINSLKPDTKELWDYWEETFSEIVTALDDNRSALNKLLILEGGDASKVKRLIQLSCKAWSEKFTPKEAKASSPKALLERRSSLLAWGKGAFTAKQEHNYIPGKRAN